MSSHILSGGGGYEVPPLIDDKVVLNVNQFVALYNKGLIDKIIFPREQFIGQMPLQLRKVGLKVENVYLTQRLSNSIFLPDFVEPSILAKYLPYLAQRLSNSISLPDFVEPYILAKYLPYLEFHIADHCNLNCKACSHYSGLVKEPHFPNLEQFTRDLERLHEFIDDIGVIRILGGEPLLNPEVNEYIKLCRRLYPPAVIRVVTNAILLPKMPESFFETLRECNAGIYISFYPPLESKMPAIKQLLEEKRVSFHVSPLIKSFKMRQALKAHDRAAESFLTCSRAACHTIYKGKIAVCSLLFPTRYFNVYYGKDLPEGGALDLYEADLTTEKLKAHLFKPIELCRYCKTPVDVEWTTIKHPSPLSDWVHD